MARLDSLWTQGKQW